MQYRNLFTYSGLKSDHDTCFKKLDDGFYRGGMTSNGEERKGPGLMAFSKDEENPNGGNIYEGFFRYNKINTKGAMFYADDKGIG
jgi:hypothetical protein